ASRASRQIIRMSPSDRCALGTLATVRASSPSRASSPGIAATSSAADSAGVADAPGPGLPAMAIVPPAPRMRTRRGKMSVRLPMNAQSLVCRAPRAGKAHPGMWDSGDTLLVIWAALSILLVVVLVAWAKVHPFLALLIAAVTMGLLAGEKP